MASRSVIIFGVSSDNKISSLPNTEAFISDQANFKLFLGAFNENAGNLSSLTGDNQIPLFSINMQIHYDGNGRFTSVNVLENGKTNSYKPEQWNKKVIQGYERSNQNSSGTNTHNVNTFGEAGYMGYGY